MRDYLNYIYNHYPIRKTNDEKEKFRNYILDELKDTDYVGYVDEIKKHHNIVIGDISSSKVIFTAHYDTPASSLIPNLMIPRNIGIWKLSHYTFPLILMLISLFMGRELASNFTNVLSVKIFFTIFFTFTIFWMLIYLFMLCFKNKHNKNDNTSGVATIMNLVNHCHSDKIAFVLFDNEEKGLLGSKAMNSKYELNDKLVINFDCVGVGDHIIFIAKQMAIKHELYEKLVSNIQSNQDFKVVFFPIEGSKSSSDYKSFECGIGVMACKCKNNVYYTSKIHTNSDNEAYNENIEFLVENMLEFIKCI